MHESTLWLSILKLSFAEASPGLTFCLPAPLLVLIPPPPPPPYPPNPLLPPPLLLCTPFSHLSLFHSRISCELLCPPWCCPFVQHNMSIYVFLRRVRREVFPGAILTGESSPLIVSFELVATPFCLPPSQSTAPVSSPLPSCHCPQHVLARSPSFATARLCPSPVQP